MIQNDPKCSKVIQSDPFILGKLRRIRESRGGRNVDHASDAHQSVDKLGNRSRNLMASVSVGRFEDIPLVNWLG
jgi:hypothetical protein